VLTEAFPGKPRPAGCGVGSTPEQLKIRESTLKR